MTTKFHQTYGFVFPDGTYQSTAIAPNIATGQTWQNMTSQRIVGVMYQNTTLRPIQLIVQRPGGDGATMSINVGDSPDFLYNSVYTAINRYGGALTVTSIVPAGYYYNVTGSQGGWYESR